MIAQMLQCKQCPDPAPPLNFINPWLSAFLPYIDFFLGMTTCFFPLWAEVAPGALKRNWRAAPPLYIGCCSQFNLIKILPVVEFILLRSCLETRWQHFLFCSAWSSVNLFSSSSCMYFFFLIDSSLFGIHFSRVLHNSQEIYLRKTWELHANLDDKCIEYSGVQPPLFFANQKSNHLIPLENIPKFLTYLIR